MNFRINFWIIICIGIMSPGLHGRSCPDTISLSMTTAYEGQDLLVTIHADHFKRMSTFQFSLNYDAAVFQFVTATSPLPSFGENVYNDNKNGNIRFVWVDSNLDGITVPDGTGIIQLRFSILQVSSTSFVEISPTQLPVEFINVDIEPLCVKTAKIDASSPGTLVKGRVWSDTNGNCVGDGNEIGLADWLVEISQGGQKLYRNTDSSGFYSAILPQGTYTLQLLARNETWIVCDEKITVIAVGDQVTGQDFVARSKVTCPLMTVDLSTPILRRCTENVYTVAYENQGTAPAENASIEITFDDDFTFSGTNADDYAVVGSVLTARLGDVAPGAKETFAVTLTLNCTTTRDGQTHCVTAKAFPNDLCIPAPSWSGAELSLRSECDETSGKALFTITNTGTGDMTSSRSYIVTEDDVMTPPQPVQLDAQEALAIELPANGTTWRIMAAQDSGYPFASVWTTLALEGCGDDGSGNFTTGYVTQFEESDRDLYIDTECRESIPGTQTNRITGLHKGYGPDKLIQHETHIEYVLSFQNTGDKPVFNVVIKNPLPATLDLATLQIGSSSHPFTYRINQQRELIFTFDNIQLPDSTLDSLASRGFVRYTIYPTAGLPDGTRIQNKAGIFFDYNAPEWTNEEFHTIGTNFVMTNVEWTGDNTGIALYPNPVQEQLILDFSASGSQFAEYQITNVAGQLISAGNVLNAVHIIPCDHFPPGQYLVRVAFQDGRMVTSQVIKR